MPKYTFKKKLKIRNKRRSNRKTHNRKTHNSKKRKTRKLLKKGGDIMYYSAPGAKDMWRAETPTDNLICLDDNKVCLAFGDVSDHVRDFFDGFVRFNFAKKVIKRIGNPSENGFVFEIENETRGYTAFSVLKSAQEPTSDNLMYEYHVGLYVNKLNKLYPCFVETYGLFKYRNEHQWTLFKDVPEKKIVNLHALQQALDEQPLDYSIGCTSSKYLAVLIQHLPGPKSLDDLSQNTTFNKNELMWALFQLYIPLAQLMNNFTHYDLHLGNILMYEPVVGKYIEYHYHFMPTGMGERSAKTRRTSKTASRGEEVISFKSSYILKIIDYGRSYFNDVEGRVDAKQIYEQICAEGACNSDDTCGSSYGLSWLADDSDDPESSFYISSQHKNISHDLVPLTRIYEKYKAKTILLTPELVELGEKVLYEGYYGTGEKLSSGYPAKINNVQDAATYIMDCIQRPDYRAHNNAVNRTKDKLGDLHIYMDGSRPMEYTF